MVHHIYLVPGFFGFANLGELVYCKHVREFLLAAFARRGLALHVGVVETRPTASLPRRAERVLATMARTLSDGEGPVHLIGHSSGGLGGYRGARRRRRPARDVGRGAGPRCTGASSVSFPIWSVCP